jgi:hypothetical protein
MIDHKDGLLIEATGKRWKGIQAAGVAIIVAGLALLLLVIRSESPGLIYLGALVATLGIGVTVYGMVGVWWHHG